MPKKAIKKTLRADKRTREVDDVLGRIGSLDINQQFLLISHLCRAAEAHSNRLLSGTLADPSPIERFAFVFGVCAWQNPEMPGNAAERILSVFRPNPGPRPKMPKMVRAIRKYAREEKVSLAHSSWIHGLTYKQYKDASRREKSKNKAMDSAGTDGE